MRSGTSARRPAAIPELGITNASCRPRPGEVKLRIPKLRMQTFEAAIIERYRRRETSVGEAVIEMYSAGVPVRRVEDIT
jgi:putative transposase